MSNFPSVKAKEFIKDARNQQSEIARILGSTR